MTRVGYARVSTGDQHPGAQEDRLRACGCELVFTDKGVSGTMARRPQWDKLLAGLSSRVTSWSASSSTGSAGRWPTWSRSSPGCGRPGPS